MTKLTKTRLLERRIYAAFSLHSALVVAGILAMKTALGVLLTLICVALSSCSRSDASRISLVLQQCAQVSQRAGAFNADPGRQADFIAREFQKIDVSSCPADFRMAYQAHVFAWQQAAPALANNSVGTNFLEGFVGGLTNNASGIGNAQSNAARAAQQIDLTYYELTQVAARHGARIPRSVAGE